jgi:CDP-diacylglycerol--glycerol-3-phosphate 3-phosphatidyltransferase
VTAEPTPIPEGMGASADPALDDGASGAVGPGSVGPGSGGSRSGGSRSGGSRSGGSGSGGLGSGVLGSAGASGPVDPAVEQGAPADPVTAPVARDAPVLNAANALTALRLVLIPVFAGLTASSHFVDPGLRVAACLVFCVASLTDFVDGWIARSYGLVTAFGKIADPIADKALTGTALVLLSGYHRLSWWVTAVILARELGITALRFWVIRHGVIAASRGGKIKTALQILAISWYLWPFPHTVAEIGPWIMGVAVIVTLVTGFDYILRAIRLRRLGRT